MVSKFTYRGKSLDELKQMSIKEVSELLDSKARRRIKRGFSDEESKLLKKINAVKGEQKNPIRTHCRSMIILPNMVGLKIAVYSGNEFKIIEVLPEMIGHCLGEYSFTRKRIQHSAPGVGATRSSQFVPIK